MIKAKVIKFGDNVDTDQIIPAQHLSMLYIKDIAEYTFQYDDNFLQNYTVGDVCVGEENFGCGSSREQAPAVLKYRGVQAVVAKSFARIFYRNCINLGLPAIECEQTDKIGNLDKIEIDMKNGIIKNITKGEEYKIKPFPDFVQNVLSAGGIAEYKLKNK